MAETCTYCGHPPGCYCECPTREGHRQAKLSYKKEEYAQALDRALVRAEEAEAENARLQARVEEGQAHVARLEAAVEAAVEDLEGAEARDKWRGEALEPFVKATQNVLNEGGNDHRETAHVRLGDIRRARAAIDATPEDALKREKERR